MGHRANQDHTWADCGWITFAVITTEPVERKMRGGGKMRPASFKRTFPPRQNGAEWCDYEEYEGVDLNA
jgi:hypothetical protein